MAAITPRVNGKAHTVNVESSTPLLYALRNEIELLIELSIDNSNWSLSFPNCPL
jgi:aerobic-type carbon monoxide dehydrogenase small subunit (CoxS/CutS family)